MSSVAPIGSEPTAVSGLTPTTGASAPPAAYLQGTLDGVASMLSMPTQNLRVALKQGSSISDIAAQKGVSRDSRVNTIEQFVQQRRAAQGKSPIDAQTLDNVVNRALDRHRHGHGHHAGFQPAPPAPQQQPSSGALDLLA